MGSEELAAQDWETIYATPPKGIAPIRRPPIAGESEELPLPPGMKPSQELIDALKAISQRQERDPNGLDAHAPGAKLDAGKLDLTLVPPELVEAVARVMMLGAEKYTRGGWRHVEGAPLRYYAALKRHLHAFELGEDDDPDTKLHHLAHAATNLAFLLAFAARGKDVGAWRSDGVQAKTDAG